MSFGRRKEERVARNGRTMVRASAGDPCGEGGVLCNGTRTTFSGAWMERQGELCDVRRDMNTSTRPRLRATAGVGQWDSASGGLAVGAWIESWQISTPPMMGGQRIAGMRHVIKSSHEVGVGVQMCRCHSSTRYRRHAPQWPLCFRMRFRCFGRSKLPWYSPACMERTESKKHDAWSSFACARAYADARTDTRCGGG